LGQPAFSQSWYARASISCLLGSGIIFLRVGARPHLLGAWGISAGPCQTSLERLATRFKSTWNRSFLAETCPQDKARRALQRMSLARDCPAPRELIKMAPAQGSAPRPYKVFPFQIARRSSGYPSGAPIEAGKAGKCLFNSEQNAAVFVRSRCWAGSCAFVAPDQRHNGSGLLHGARSG